MKSKNKLTKIKPNQELQAKTDFDYFIDAGYEGLYGLSKEEVFKSRGVRNWKEFELTMSGTELALNAFKNTQTLEKLKKRRCLYRKFES